ncbi:Hypothetical protein NTJ_11825 [Nesidiocoris tenuis]|uniref:Uncharacterized protein n=1 Tax=Nesidiocoris tenuis TaxID=355587 RepID=A0ABN7B3M9_9HEMI|nr:Hypothetical protein NTJ_11825 [Nesidiocoris tenuis]
MRASWHLNYRKFPHLLEIFDAEDGNSCMNSRPHQHRDRGEENMSDADGSLTRAVARNKKANHVMIIFRFRHNRRDSRITSRNFSLSLPVVWSYNGRTNCRSPQNFGLLRINGELGFLDQNL